MVNLTHTVNGRLQSYKLLEKLLKTFSGKDITIQFEEGFKQTPYLKEVINELRIIEHLEFTTSEKLLSVIKSKIPNLRLCKDSELRKLDNIAGLTVEYKGYGVINYHRIVGSDTYIITNTDITIKYKKSSIIVSDNKYLSVYDSKKNKITKTIRNFTHGDIQLVVYNVRNK